MIAATIPTWSAAVGIVAGLFAIAAGLAGLVAYFKANMGKATIDILKINNEALEQQNGLQQLQLDKQATTIRGLEDKVILQQGQIDTLKELASGKTAVEELAIILADRHIQLLTAIKGTV